MCFYYGWIMVEFIKYMVKLVVHPWTPIGHIQVCSWFLWLCELYDSAMLFLNLGGFLFYHHFGSIFWILDFDDFLNFQLVHGSNVIMAIFHIGALNSVHGYCFTSILVLVTIWALLASNFFTNHECSWLWRFRVLDFNSFCFSSFWWHYGCKILVYFMDFQFVHDSNVLLVVQDIGV